MGMLLHNLSAYACGHGGLRVKHCEIFAFEGVLRFTCTKNIYFISVFVSARS